GMHTDPSIQARPWVRRMRAAAGLPRRRGVAALRDSGVLLGRPRPREGRSLNLAILQARMTSKRLPGKVMAPVLGAPMIGRQIERIKRAKRIDKLVMATSTDPSDDELAAYVQSLGVADVFRGSLDDVL